MSAQERRLAIACRETRQGVIRLVNLIEGRVDRSTAAADALADDTLIDEFNRYLRRTDELSEAALRPPALGVVGIRGSGATDVARRLVAAGVEGVVTVNVAMQAEPLDYMRHLAPPATALGQGVAQRFQSRVVSSSARNPVGLALLKPVDIALILARLHAVQVAHARDPLLDTDQLRRSVIELGQHLGLFVMPGMTASDIHAIRDAVSALYGMRASTRTLEASGFWSSVAALITHLPNSARGRLLSPLWGGLANLTAVFVDLMDALEALGYADEVLAPIDAVARLERPSQVLMPRTDSIVVGETAKGFAGGDIDLLDVQTRSRQSAKVTRSALAALTLEVRWSVRSRPGGLLGRADVLQLPEIAASTSALHDAEQLGIGSSTLAEAFHNAKVDHILRRYALEHDLTALAVTVDMAGAASHRLAPTVAEWIGLAQGADPDQRAHSDPALAIALTNADAAIARVGSPAQLDSRIEAALDTVLGVVDPEGARVWTPGRGFDAVALLGATGRAPIAQPELVGAAAAPSGRVVAGHRGDAGDDTSASGFIMSPGVRAHVRNPYAAWADLAGPSAGLGRLAELVDGSLDGVVKQRQIAEDLATTCRELKYIVERHLYRMPSLYGRLNRRHREALILVTRLRRDDVQSKLGHLLKVLQLTEGELADALYNFDMRPRLESTSDISATGANVARRSIGEPRGTSGLGGRSYASAVIGQWMMRLRSVARSPESAQIFKISRANLHTLTEELIAGAARLGLADRLARRLDPLLMTSDDAIGRSSMVALQAVELIGTFVTDLDGGVGPVGRDDHGGRVPPPPGFSAVRASPASGGRSLDERVCRFHDQWCSAFLELVRRNAGEGPAFSSGPESKDELGDLLKLFSFYAVEWGL